MTLIFSSPEYTFLYTRVFQTLNSVGQINPPSGLKVNATEVRNNGITSDGKMETADRKDSLVSIRPVLLH